MKSNPVEKEGWILTFQDEFDHPLLNDLYWFPAYRTGRGEYLRRLGKPYLWHDDNAYYTLNEGKLRLRIDETLPIRPSAQSSCVSCIVTSDHRIGKDPSEVKVFDKFSQKYGYFEMRAKGVKGSGYMAAFWLHQVDPLDQEFSPEGLRREDAGAVEIDIFEQRGVQNDGKESKIDYNVHFTEKGHYLDSVPCDVSRGFHIYAMEWEEGKITWYFDNKPVRVYKGPTPQKKMFLLAALFHYENWLGNFDPKRPFPVDFEIDYIRIYRKK